MRYLITGGAGLIGTTWRASSSTGGHQVHVLDDLRRLPEEPDDWALRNTVNSGASPPGRASRPAPRYQPAPLDSILEEHGRGAANHGQALWAMLTLEVFLRREGW